MTEAAGATDRELRTRLVGANILAIGLCSGLIQVVLIRQLLIVCSGSELTVGIILGVWMFSGALGCFWGGRQAKADGDATRTAARVAFLTALSLVASLAAIALIRVSPELFLRLPGALTAQRGETFGLIQILLVTICATFPAAFILEAQFGSAISLYIGSRGGASHVARSYAIDAAGHLLGGTAAAYVLTRWLDPHTAVASVALLSLFCALLLWSLLSPAGRSRLPRYLAAAVVLLAVPVVLTASALDDYTLAVRWRGYELLANVETLQSNIVVARHGAAGKVFFINGEPSAYTETMPQMQMLVHFTMLQHPEPRRVLLVGGLGRGAVEEVLKHDIERVDYFELDPGLLDVYAEYRGALPSGRAHIWKQDLRAYLRGVKAGTAQGAWDVVILALPPPLTAVVNRHYTRECFEQIAASSPEAVIGMILPGTQTYYSADLLRLDTSLLSAVPPVGPRPGQRVVLMPGYSLYAVIGPDSRYMTDEPDEMLRRLTERGVTAPYWESVIYDLLEPMNIEFVREQLETFPQPPLNTDLRPIAYFYSQVYTMRQFHPLGAKVLDAAARLNWRAVIAATLGLCVLLVCLVAGVRRLRGFAVPAVVAGTGLIGMVLQLGVLYAFQIYVGHIYSLIGVLNGAFMVGLAGGGLLAGRLLRGADTTRTALAYLSIGLALLALVGFAFTALIAIVTGIAPSSSTWALSCGFFVISLFLGGLVGVQFPLATEAAAEAQSRGPVAAAMYAADLLGASSGAVIAGTLLIPLFGVGGTATLCGLMAGALLVICLLRRALP